jgi:hypothetical protein
MQRHATKVQELQSVSARLGDVIINLARWLTLIGKISAAVFEQHTSFQFRDTRLSET